MFSLWWWINSTLSTLVKRVTSIIQYHLWQVVRIFFDIPITLTSLMRIVSAKIIKKETCTSPQHFYYTFRSLKFSVTLEFVKSTCHSCAIRYIIQNRGLIAGTTTRFSYGRLEHIITSISSFFWPTTKIMIK